MTGTDAADQLVAAGLDAAESGPKARLFEQAFDGIRRLGATPDTTWWVPGRLEVFGKHTDYAGGHSLVAPLARGFAAAGARRPGNAVHVLDARYGERFTVPFDAAGTSGWKRYVATTVARLARNFPAHVRGAAIAFASDLPRASGMSSSSALVVSVASALVRLWGIEEAPEWRGSIRTDEDRATYLACIENGEPFLALAGDRGVGTQGGSEDHAAMLLGRPGTLTCFSFLPLRRVADVPVPRGWTFVVATSGVAARKTGEARSAYNRLSASVSVLLQLWNAENVAARSLAAALASRPDASGHLRALVESSVVSGWPPEALETRLEHFRREDALALAAVAALAAGDVAQVGELAAASFHAAETLLRNQVPETSMLVRLALELGAQAASPFGAGFGGSVWALVADHDSHRFARAWLDAAARAMSAARPIEISTGTGPAAMDLLQTAG